MTEGTTKKFGKRTAGFKRNDGLEYLLKSLNTDMQPSEQGLLARYSIPKMPLIFVMGPPRSGTTLLMQWLANTGIVSYPTNLLSRFYEAPIIGAKIQLMLTDPRYNFRDELGEFVQQSKYVSENGKTNGVLAPNEFWYFWRRFLSVPARDVWSDDELRQTMDTATMLAELAGIMDVFDKPFATKGLLFNNNIPFLNSIFDKVVFVQIKRDPIMNIQSVLGARERQLGSRNAWYSFDISERQELKDLAPIEQVAGQIAYINRAVNKGLSEVSSSRKLSVQYEDFCENPVIFFDLLKTKLSRQGHTVELDHYMGEKRFTAVKSLYLSKDEAHSALKAYRDYLK